MENNVWYDLFLETLYKKFPKRQDLFKALSDLLFIEREAVYRRIRRDVVFTAYEIAKIATEWNISLDDVIGIDSGRVHFQMREINYLNPSEEEMKFLWAVIQGLNNIQNYYDTEFMDIGNKLPRQLLAGYKYLNQFYLFKWIFQYSHNTEVIPFSHAIESKEKAHLTSEYYKAIKTVPNSNFIWDRKIFENMISDIRYFVSISMITVEEKNLIKKDIHDLLDYLFVVANEGFYPETKNKVNIYVSELNIDTNYSYTFSKEANICFVHVFEKLELYSYNPQMVLFFKDWMQLKKKSSVQISVVDERCRIEYFNKQRQIIDEL